MGQPSITPRQTPVGRFQEEGYQTLVTFQADPDVSLWELDVQPFGLSIGDKIEVTNMHNTERRTYAPRALYEATDGAMRVSYDAAVLPQIRALIGVRTGITIRHPNSDAWADWGYLASFEPDRNAQGEMPQADCVIVFTGVDPSDGTESVPVYEADVGTGT